MAVVAMVAVLAMLPRLDIAFGKSAPAPVGSAGGAKLLFRDEFDGRRLNAATWHTCSWWARSTCSIEFNDELELYVPNRVSVAGGILRLQARREPAVGWNGRSYAYTSGMISSGGRPDQPVPGFAYRYGYAEARVRVPAGRGLWPAFWTLPADHSWPPEIDAMEILGEAPDVSHMTYHYLDTSGAHRAPSGSWAGPDFSTGWHTFGVDWEPEAVVWYVDGVERMRFADARAITGTPSYLVLNLAVGGRQAGPPDDPGGSPGDYLVDYVRVWDRFGPSRP